MSDTFENTAPSRSWPDYRAVWRWHFYAGMLCIPFVIILSITGTIYLFKPQIEAWNDRPYDNLASTGNNAGAAAQIEAAVAAVPGSSFNAYHLPTANNAAARVLVEKDQVLTRVYVHPASLQILHATPEDGGLIALVKRIHGELLIGDTGSHFVEIAACWTIVMVLSGLFLWWPRQAKGFGGVLYPRLNGGSRMFWRDIHSVTGIWVSFFVLFLVTTGLPWATFWGEYFKGIRRLTGTAVAKQDWSTSSGESRKGASGGGQEPKGEHANHGEGQRGGGPGRKKTVAISADQLRSIDRVVAVARPMNLAPPVLVTPVAGSELHWEVSSLTANRPQRVTLVIDAKSGAIVKRSGFADRHWIDRAVGTGIAIHEGQMFGWVNQLLGVATTAGLLLLSLSGLVLWWRRRDRGVLGAPAAGMNPRFSFVLVSIVFLLGALLPLFGASLIAVLLCEKLLLRRIPPVSRWLGLYIARPELAAE